MAGNDADADDATQEALITIAKRIDRFDGRSAFTTWMYRVATNACLDELRRRGRRAVPGLPDEIEYDTAGAPSFETSIIDRLTLDDALASLPDEFVAPVVLRDQLGMNYAEIAETLEIPAGTVRSRIARGRKRLAQQLGGNQSTPTPRQTDETP